MILCIPGLESGKAIDHDNHDNCNGNKSKNFQELELNTG